jgi:hypothetical protein
MNRRRFLALLGSTAVAPALPAAAIGSLYTGGTQQQAVFGTSYIEQFAADQAALNAAWRSMMDAAAYGTGWLRFDGRTVEHIPAPRMFTEEAA